MASPLEHPQEPPGTFQLIRDAGHGEAPDRKVVMLDPIPSRDPNDPLNWSAVRKAVNFGLVLAVSAVIFTALSIQIIFWQQMQVDLNVTYEELNNTNSVNFVGLAVGCILFIPLAKKFGRRPVYLAGTAVMAAMSFWTAELNSLSELYATNLIYGLAGATNEAIVQITIADIAFVHRRGSLNGLYLSMVMTGSFLAPMGAGAQATAVGWRWCFHTLGICTSVLFVLFLFFYEETKYTPLVSGINVLQPIATDNSALSDIDKKHLSPATAKPGIEYEQPSESFHEIDYIIPMRTWRQRLSFITYTDESIWPYFYRPLIVLFSFPAVLFTGLQYAAGVAWLTTLASVAGIVLPAPPYNFTPAQVGYMNAGPFIGNLIGALYGGFLGDRAILFYSRRNQGMFEPEMRLYLLHLPVLALTGGIIMFGVSLGKGQHWIVPSIGGALFGFGLGSIGDASLTFVIDSHKELTGDAFTGIAFLRNAISIGIPFAITPWMNRSGLQNMFVACGFIALAISGLIVPMILYGKHFRSVLAVRYRRFAGEQGREL